MDQSGGRLISNDEAVAAAIKETYGANINRDSFVVVPTVEKVMYQPALGSLRIGYVVSLNGSPEGQAVPDAIKGDLMDILVDGRTAAKVAVVNRVDH